MNIIKRNDVGPAVTDVQTKLVALGYIPKEAVDGIFGASTADAIRRFCADTGIGVVDEVDEQVWARLVDATFSFGDRNLYLRVPFFHGHDVEVLQSALSALGFSCGEIDGIFGAHTEEALRTFQLNMGLPSDGIAGGFTFRALNNLSHSWKDKTVYSPVPHLGFARAADVLENNLICLFGTTPFTRSVASRMSNLALATNPVSQVTSAETLLVKPSADMLFVQIMVGEDEPAGLVPVVEYEPFDSLPLRLSQGIQAAEDGPDRIAIRLPGEQWESAGEARSAQHYAIALLDAICSALLLLQEN